MMSKYDTDSYLLGMNNGMRRTEARHKIKDVRNIALSFVLGSLIGAIAITEFYSYVR